MNLIELLQRVVGRFPIYFVQLKTLIRKEGILNTSKKVFKKVFRFVLSGGKGSRLMALTYGDWMKNIEGRYLIKKNTQI